MSDTTSTPSEQPASQAPVETPGAQPTNLDPAAALQSISQEQLGSLLFADRPAETVADAAPTQTPPEAAKPPVETPPTDPEGEQPPEAGKPDLRRIPMGGVPMSERQQMAEVARMIRSGEASTQVEALTKMGLLGTPTATPSQTTPEAAPAEPSESATTPPPAPIPSNDRVAELEAKIAELRVQRDQAEEDYDIPEKRRLTAEIEDTVGILATARIEAREQQASASTYQNEYLSAVDAMEEKYAWATDPESPLYEALNDKVTAAQARQDPALNDPNYIITFADRIAEQFGTPVKTTPPPPPPTQAPKIIGGGVAPAHSEANVPTEIEAKAIIANATKEQLAAALFG